MVDRWCVVDRLQRARAEPANGSQSSRRLFNRLRVAEMIYKASTRLREFPSHRAEKERGNYFGVLWWRVLAYPYRTVGWTCVLEHLIDD